MRKCSEIFGHPEATKLQRVGFRLPEARGSEIAGGNDLVLSLFFFG